MVKQEWAMTTWAEKGDAVNWAPVGRAINNTVIDAYGRLYGTNYYGSSVPRRPYKTDTADGVTYIMYDDDTEGAVPVIRLTEEEV